MSKQVQQHVTAGEVRERNRELDRELWAEIDAISPDELRVDQGEEWSIDKNLGHIAEFPRYFARQLGQWLVGERTVLGRVAEYSADRNDAVVRSVDRPLEDLRQEVASSFVELAQVLERLEDEHLTRPTQNVKYGEEVLMAFLDRYVLGHKAAHLRQLREARARIHAR
ncbi:MAG: hypothetical protein GEU78_10205 [Actinobacteria bacterium]|nr:hypothetical protein [Actinomycetota bacterium]